MKKYMEHKNKGKRNRWRWFSMIVVLLYYSNSNKEFIYSDHAFYVEDETQKGAERGVNYIQKN